MKNSVRTILSLTYFGVSSFQLSAQGDLIPKISTQADALESKMIAWRRDFHQHPELGNQETRTAGIVAEHLKKLGLEVKEKVAVTGIVGILKGDKPGPVVALRADMDGLPVTERANVPFKSTVKTTFNGQETGVMHACGHDTHVAILMAVAEILSSMKKDLAGTVKFIFQPAEEGVSGLETFGAKQMVGEGVLQNPAVEAVFGLHINAQTEVGKITYRSGPTMAAVDELSIKVLGKSSHGARPWASIDPIVAAAQIITGLQTIVSRNVDITANPAVVTIGAVHGGIRQNIIPESVEMIGTIRTFDKSQKELIHRRIKEIAGHTAESAGGKAEVRIHEMYPVTFNDPALTAKMLPVLLNITGKENVSEAPLATGAEDFSYYQEKVPGLYFFLGGMPKGTKPEESAPHHTPDFYIDESGLTLGVKALASLAVDYLGRNDKPNK